MSDYGDIPIAHRHRIAIMAHRYFTRGPGCIKALRDLAYWYDTTPATVTQIWLLAFPRDARPTK